MRVEDGVEMLEITATIMGRATTIYPTLIWDNISMILVDTGYPGQLSLIREAITKAGLSFERLNKIIITHHDIDHIGSLPSILAESPQKIDVLAHNEEKPHIQGEKGILKVNPNAKSQLEAQLSSLPEEQRKAIINNLLNPPKAPVDQTISDGEELPYCGGITVIHTPGHTHGHICLYLKESKTLITGDALNILDGKLIGPIPEYTYDMEQAAKSLKKLTQFDIEKVISYHGGFYEDNVNQRIDELAKAN